MLQWSRQCDTGEKINLHKSTEESPEIDPCIYSRLIFDKGARVRRKDFQQMMLENLDIHTHAKNESQPITHAKYKNWL